MHAQSLQSCLTLCHPMDCSLLSSSLPGLFQARILECAAIPCPRGSSWPRDQTCVFCIAGRFFIYWVTWEALCGIQFSSVAQSCPTLYDPMICSMPGLPVHHQLLEFNYRCSNLLLSHITVQFSQHHLLRRLPFLHYIFLSPSL